MSDKKVIKDVPLWNPIKQEVEYFTAEHAANILIEVEKLPMRSRKNNYKAYAGQDKEGHEQKLENANNGDGNSGSIEDGDGAKKKSGKKSVTTGK